MSHAAPPSKRSTTSGKAEDDDAKPYVIVSEIGKGSFATVYKGYHEVSQYWLGSNLKPNPLSGNATPGGHQVRQTRWSLVKVV